MRIVARLLVGLLLLIADNAYASHIVGLELLYTHITGNTYKISLVVYGDCGPASSGAFSTLPVAAPSICVYNGATSVATVTLAVQSPSSGVEITPVCHADSLLTQCTSTSYTIPGIKKFVYSANYTVPSASSTWRFVFTGDLGGAGSGGSAGRAAAITNILSGTTTQIVDTLNNALDTNSNPRLTTVPVPFFCLNNSDSYNPGAVDPDGDSLSFALVSGVAGTAACSAGSPVTYTGSYSGSAPLGVAAGSFSLDPNTGQISFFPNILQRALVVYNVREFRHGAFMGSCQREMTFLVLTCTDLPPSGVLSSASGGTLVDSTHFKICQNSGPFSININPTESDTSNTITISASGIPAGATYTILNNGTNHPTSTFSWSSTGVTPGTYIFYLTFRDNACPISGTQTRAYTITILPQPTVHASGGATFCAGGSTVLSATGTGAPTYAWAPGTGLACGTCSTTLATPSATILYTLTGTDTSGCKNTDTVSVRILPLPTINAGPDVNYCVGGGTILTGSGGVTYTWAPATGLSCTTCTNPTANPTSTTTYTLTGVGANGCRNTDAVIITVNPLPLIDAGLTTRICNGSTATLTPTGGVSYVWASGTTLSCTSCTSPVASPSATTVYTVTGTDVNGCRNADTVRVIVNPLPVIHAGPGSTFCLGGSSTLSATGGISYVWAPGTGLSCTSCAAPAASPAVTTLYTVTGTDINGCSNRDTTRITIKPLPVIDAGPNMAFCAGSAVVLSGSGGSSYTWTPGTGLSCTTCSSPVATPAATTVYTLTGVGANGCTNSDTVRVTVNPLPAIRAGAPVTLCRGSSISLAPTGGVSYVWAAAGSLSCTSCTSPVASPSLTTVYTVTGTDASGCRNSDTVRVSVYLAPPIDAGPNGSVCIGSSATLAPSGGLTYVWTPGTGLSCTSCTSPAASPSATTVYSVLGTDAFGCQATDTVRITVNPLPVIDGGPTATVCLGNTTTLTGSGGVSYSWVPGTGLSCTSCTSPSAGPSATTLYTVTGTDANGCRNTDTVRVIVNPLPTITVGPAANICIGSSAVLTTSGATSYTWSPATGLSCTTCTIVTASPFSTTTYTVTGIDANGCSNTGTARLGINPLPTIVAIGPAYVCRGTAVTLTASGGVSYTWSPGTALSCTFCSSTSAAPTATTTYSLTGTDANGCVNSDTITLTIRSLPVIDAGPDPTVCLGNSAMLHPSGGTSYVWGPGIGLSCTSCASPFAGPSATTIYTVTGTDAFGCRNTDTLLVTIIPLPVIGTGLPSQICPGGSTTLSGTGGLSYTWAPGSSLSCTACANPVASPTATTVYTVTGTGSNGCQNNASVTVTVNPLPAVVLGPPADICVGGSTMLTAAGAVTYSWSPAASISCPTCYNPIASPAATTLYSVTAVSSAGCANTDTITVFVHPLPLLTVSNSTTKCFGDPYPMAASGGSSYTWSPAAGLSCAACASPVATPFATTTYKVVVATPYGCKDSASVTVTINPLPVLHLSPSPVSLCLGKDTTLTVTGASSYLWTPATGLSANTGSIVTAHALASIVYTVTGTDANNCIGSTTEVVSVGALSPPPTVVSPVNYCLNETAIPLTATGSNLVWYGAPSGGAGSSAAPIPSTAVPGKTIYYVTQSSNGCESPLDSILVTVFDVVHPGFQFTPFMGCSWDSLIFTNTSTNATKYLWSFGDGTSDTSMNPTHNYNIATDTIHRYVTLRAYNPACHSDSVTKDIVLYPVPAKPFLYDMTADQAIPYGRSIQLGVHGGWIYYWKPDNGTLNNPNISNPIASPQEKTTYTVYSYQHQGCIDSAHVTIDVLTTTEVIPSAFTPNGDGINDVFRVVNLAFGRLVEMHIYNRWGQEVCRTNDNEKGWDGMFEGVPQDLGVFNYYIIIERENHKEVHYKGTVTLIR